MSQTDQLQARQIWVDKTSTQSPATFCTSFTLPSGGIIRFNKSYATTLTENVLFQQPCGPNATPTDVGSGGNSCVVGLRDAFYASTSPHIFAIATATVISYLLVILIFITPRTYFVGGPGGGAGFLGRRGMISGSYGGSSVVGVGRRPWLQKIATITVAVSLTIATADTFKVAERQYNLGYVDSAGLVDDVVGSLEIRIVRLISDTFLWLAQVQTLIRLFPRHKEKVTIKWLGFAMVSFDTIFSVLNDFGGQSDRTRPRSFKDAIPALSYLFELAISLIYTACVIYYALSKRRFAFYHPKMRNVCLVALLSLMAVFVPVVFFILDISNPDVAGWGDYIRWVGAAAASVVVWEWVERIETLERDERKDGILGREIFDGDEMLADEAQAEEDWPGRREYWDRSGFTANDAGDADVGGQVSQRRALRSRIPFGKSRRSKPANINQSTSTPHAFASVGHTDGPTLPAQTVTPISRTDTNSADSTIYTIRYHTLGTPTLPIAEEPAASSSQVDTTLVTKEIADPSASTTGDVFPTNEVSHQQQENPPDTTPERIQGNPVWRAVTNPFKRKRTSPPAEVAGAQLSHDTARRSSVDRTMSIKSGLKGFTPSRRERNSGRNMGNEATPMAMTVIPAQHRVHRSLAANDSEAEGHEFDIQALDSAPAADSSWDTVVLPSQHPQHRDNAMPITVIPAPRRGQRTWSPDDLNQKDPPQTLQNLVAQGGDEQSQSLEGTDSHAISRRT